MSWTVACFCGTVFESPTDRCPTCHTPVPQREIALDERELDRFRLDVLGSTGAERPVAPRPSHRQHASSARPASSSASS